MSFDSLIELLDPDNPPGEQQRSIAGIYALRASDLIIETALRTPYSHIMDGDGTVYMERYWLREYDKDNSRSAARVHHILKSDIDGATHDHPWDYTTVILKGGYREHTPMWDNDGIYTGECATSYKAGDILWRKARDWHWLEIEPGVDTWTLFISGKYQQRWGFLTQPAFKTYWRDHKRAIGKPDQKLGAENYHGSER